MASELLKTRLLFFFTTLRLPRRGYVEVSDTDGSEGAQKENPKADLKETNRPRKLTTSTYLAILGIGIIAIVTIVVTLILQRSRAGPRFTVYPLPSLEATKSKPFLPDYKYWNLSSSHSASAWDVLGRHGDVLIPSSDLDGYGLPRGLETSVDGYDGFPLSAFHQLHCLKSIRKHYVALQSNTPIVDSVDNHVDHCFDYLRQAIMCSADMTLEKARVDPDGHRRRVDGWGTMHKCRDWGRVREIVEERRQI